MPCCLRTAGVEHFPGTASVRFFRIAVKPLSGQRPAHQLYPVKIDRLPEGIVNLKSQLLFPLSAVNHCRSAVFQIAADPVPQLLTHACAEIADIYAGAYFAEPFCNIAPDPGRTVAESDHYHLPSPP